MATDGRPRTAGAALERVRIDKWLWAARFFKTRSLAAEAVVKGRVRLAGETCKPAKDVRAGDLIKLEIEHLQWEIVVLGLAETRGPAPVAQALYQETTESRERRGRELERRKLYREPTAMLQGRPTKRERRVIDRLSGRDESGSGD